MKKILTKISSAAVPARTQGGVLYLAHHAERPQENDALFHDYKEAEAYIKDSALLAGAFQIFKVNYELSPQGVKDVMNWLMEFYLNRER